MSASQQIAYAAGTLLLVLAIVALFTLGQASTLQAERTREQGPQQGALRRIVALSLTLATVSAASLVCFSPVVRTVVDAIGTRAWEPVFWVFLLGYILLALVCAWELAIAVAAHRVPSAAGSRHPARRRASLLTGSVGRRWVRLLGWLFIVAAPAYYAFTPLPPNSVSRLGFVGPVIFVMRAGFVIVGVLIASGYDIPIDRLAKYARHMRSESRQEAGGDILRRLLPPRGAPASGYEWALYVPLPGGKRIGPVPGVSPADARTWARGEGVTGTAWATGEWTRGVGSDLAAGGKYTTADGSPSRKLEVVVAHPVFNSEGKVIAVLTAASDQHLNFLLTKRGQWEHVQLSIGISRVLVDFLGFGESWIFLAWGNERATGRRKEGEAAGIAEYNTAGAPRHNENSVGEAGTGSEPAEPISFADVVRMTHKQACQPDALLQALHASPERTRDV